MEDSYTTQAVESWIERLREGDQAAVGELMRCATARMTKIARRMLSRFPVVGRWEEEEDLLQDISLRMVDQLRKNPPTDAQHFFRLSARMIRQHLIDLSRRYRGPQNHAFHHATQSPAINRTGPAPLAERAMTNTDDPQKLMQWTQMHEAAEKLPDDLREVFELMFYHELKQVEVQKLLKCDPKTVRKRWMQARLAIQRAIEEENE